jgi:ABC-2 type transport system permease protein
MVIKDLKTFLRDPVQWSQFLVFFGLLAVYFLNLKTLNYDIVIPFWKNIIAFLNLAATALTLSTFTARFVYPQLSLEGRRFWIVGMAPMRTRKLLLCKFAFAFWGSFVVSESLVIISGYMLEVPWELAALHCVTVVAICFGLSGMAVGLGALYPNFREDNPSKIVSGFGGTLNLILSLIFVGVVIAAEVAPCNAYYARQSIGPQAFQKWVLATLLFIALISAVACLVPLYLGLKKIERIEVT